MVELAFCPGTCVAQIAGKNRVNNNVIFKWLRVWQNEDCVSRRLPATVESSPSPTMLPVEVIPNPVSSDKLITAAGQLSTLNAASCCVELRHGKITLENPSPELLAVLFDELTGRLLRMR